MPIVKADRTKALAYLANRDWTESDALTNEDIARQVASNPDAAPLLEDEDFSKWKRVRGRPRTDAQPNLTMPREPGGAVNVTALRNRLKMTQAEFAKAFGFSTAAVRSIEQGVRTPSGPTKTVLKMIERDPDFVRDTLSKAS
jgi:putative transcriptional regulator